MVEESIADIPYPGLKSWMFQRSTVPDVPPELKIENYLKQPFGGRVVEAILSRLWKYNHVGRRNKRWVLMRGVVGFFRWWFRIFNRFKVYGREKIPDRAIFYLNHPGSFDVLILLGVVGRPVSCFFSFGNGWFSDMLHEMMGFVSKRIYGRDALIEMSIRRLLKDNSYFAIWPEGGLSGGEAVKEGYSSVVRVYSVINNKRDIVPFVPVLIRGSSCYAYHFTPTTTPIDVHVLDPFFLPREWLLNPAEDTRGKTPREIVDFLMLKLAKKRGQRELVENRGLRHRRARYKAQMEAKQ